MSSKAILSKVAFALDLRGRDTGGDASEQAGREVWVAV